MHNDINSGMNLAIHSDEETVPLDTWVTYLKNIARQCIINFHLAVYSGHKYIADIFWIVLILHCLMNLSIDEAANRYNDYLWKERLRTLRRKHKPRHFGGRGNRTERLCPNGDQVRKYRNSLPNYVVKDLNRVIFEAQLDYARKEKLITNTVELLVDNTDQWYYGSDRFPANPFITKGHNGPGTNHKRKYIAIMLKSAKTYLYCGVDLVAKHTSNVPFIMNTIDWLIQKDFQIRHVLGDRWFPTYEFLSELQVRGIFYIGPYKKWAPIKRLIEDYLKNGKHYIQEYLLKGAPAQWYHSPAIKLNLIFINRRGKRLRDIRQTYLKSGKKPKEFYNDIMVMMTTYPPPKGKKKQQGWANRICHEYDHRWNIETGFRDLNRISPPSNARTNLRKFLMFTVRFWIFNAWHLQRAKQRLKRTKKKYKIRETTLRQFSYRTLCLEGCV